MASTVSSLNEMFKAKYAEYLEEHLAYLEPDVTERVRCKENIPGFKVGQLTTAYHHKHRGTRIQLPDNLMMKIPEEIFKECFEPEHQAFDNALDDLLDK